MFRFIVLLEGKSSARLRFWMLWTGFLLRLSLYLGALSFSSTLMCSSVPAAEKQPHATSTLYFWDGTLQVMSRAGSLQTWCLELRFIRPDNIISHSLRVLYVLFLQIPSVFSCVFTEERTEFGHTSIKPRSMECCSGVCPSVGFSHLHIWAWSSTTVTIKSLVTALTKALLHQLFSLARRTALGRILVVSNFFH